MLYYYVNTKTTYNPNHNHEVHIIKCPFLPAEKNREPLGYFNNGNEAVRVAINRGYRDADGCAVCCPEAHKA